jgi:hypothetical protein
MNNENARVLTSAFDNQKSVEGVEEILEEAFVVDEVKYFIDLEKSSCQDYALKVSSRLYIKFALFMLIKM